MTLAILGQTEGDETFFQQAIVAFEAILRLYPKHIEASINKGKCHRTLHEYDEAETCFTLVTDAAPNWAEGFINLGVLFHEQSKSKEALAAFDKAIELQPKNPGQKFVELIHQV